MSALRWSALLVLAVVSATPLLAQANPDRQRAYGQHLGRECVSCHRLDGVDNGIPAIIGWPVTTFVETMGYYKAGQRANAAMVSVAQSLDDADVTALAVYFATLPPPPKRKP